MVPIKKTVLQLFKGINDRPNGGISCYYTEEKGRSEVLVPYIYRRMRGVVGDWWWRGHGVFVTLLCNVKVAGGPLGEAWCGGEGTTPLIATDTAIALHTPSLYRPARAIRAASSL